MQLDGAGIPWSEHRAGTKELSTLTLIPLGAMGKSHSHLPPQLPVSCAEHLPLPSTSRGTDGAVGLTPTFSVLPGPSQPL